MFVTSITLLILAVIASIIYQLADTCDFDVEHGCPLSEFCVFDACKDPYIKYSVISLQLVMLVILALPFAGTLAIFHVRNYCLGKTTNERFSKKARR